MTTTTAVHANSVSRILNRHHRRSVRETTSVRGWHRTYEGFTVTQDHLASVRVDHTRPSSVVDREGIDWGGRTMAQLAAYVETLTAAGYSAQVVGVHPYAWVQVTR